MHLYDYSTDQSTHLIVSRYRDCARYSLETDCIDQALQYAEKELELERCTLGTETDHLRKGMQDAQSWIKHLRKERFRIRRMFYERMNK